MKVKVKGTLHEEQQTLFITSRSFLLRMRNVSHKIRIDKAHILCSVRFFENLAVCEIMCKSIVEPNRPQMTV